MNAGRPSFFQRIRHFLAWDGWIVRRELPEGFRLRRYVAWNMVGVLCGTGLMAGAVALALSTSPKNVVDILYHGDNAIAPGWFFIAGCLGLVASWIVFHCLSRMDIHLKSGRRRSTIKWAVCLILFAAIAMLAKPAMDSAKESPYFVLSAELILFVAFLLFRVALSPKKIPRAGTYGMFDGGRFLAGIVRPILLLWAFYILATPLRPLDPRPVPPTAIPDWLKDENGEIARPREFLVADGEVPEWDSSAWSNLIERLGEPLPPEIRLAFEMRGPSRYPRDKQLGMDANDRMREVLEESRTNLVSLSAFPDEQRNEVEDWMAVCEKRLSRYEQCTGPQIWRFVATNSPRSAIMQSFQTPLPMFGEDFRLTQADLLFSADSGSAEAFSEAVNRADVFRSACLRFEDSLIHHLVAQLVSSTEIANVVRFCERPDLEAAAFVAVRQSLDERPPLCLARGTARACALDGETPSALKKQLFDEVGVAFWKTPRFDYRHDSSPGLFMRCVGAFTMLATGCDYRGFATGAENRQSWTMVGMAAMVEPEDNEERKSYLQSFNPWFYETGNPVSFESFWKRGGIVRRLWNGLMIRMFNKYVVKAIFADAFPAVEDAALLLAQARAKANQKPPIAEEHLSLDNTEDDLPSGDTVIEQLAPTSELSVEPIATVIPERSSVDGPTVAPVEPVESSVSGEETRFPDPLAERLARNHTRIDVSFHDITLYDAVLEISDLAGVPVLTSMMEERDRETTENDKEEQSPRRISYYSTLGMKLDWREVLGSVLEPEYTFDEKDGMVRVMTKKRMEEMFEEEKARQRRIVPIVLRPFREVDSGSAFVELRHAAIEPPENAVEGASAYVLALVPKKTAPEWFRSLDRIAAWVVVRNPAFPGTRPFRLYVLENFTGENDGTLPGNPFAATANARLAIPAALFGSDAEAIAAAERTMEDDRWQLR